MERSNEVTKMIAKVQKKKELKERDAIEYMLAVATGRLAALWRYDDSLPEGKTSKGVRVAGKRKAAERAKSIVTALHTDTKATKVKAAKAPKVKAAKATEEKVAAE